MFQQFSYKKKFYALAILAILLGATAYKRSFKGTLDAIEFYYHSKKDLNKNAFFRLNDYLISLCGGGLLITPGG